MTLAQHQINSDVAHRVYRNILLYWDGAQTTILVDEKLDAHDVHGSLFRFFYLKSN